MAVVPLRPDWPGLTRTRGARTIWHHSGLIEATRELVEELTSLTRSTVPAGSVSFPAAIIGPDTFGAWSMAMAASESHESARSNSLSVYRAALRNLRGVTARLAATSHHYDSTEDALGEQLRRLGGVPFGEPLDAGLFKRHETSSSSDWRNHRPVRADQRSGSDFTDEEPPSDQAGPADGTLPVVRRTPMMAHVEGLAPSAIAQFLQPLQKRTAWEEHYGRALEWRRSAHRMDELCRVLFHKATEIDRYWSDQASPSAQVKLQHIEGTCRSLADFSSLIARLAHITGEALDASLRGVQLYPARFRRSDWADQMEAAFHQINTQYREVIDAHPSGLSFSLPFGGVRVPAPVSASPSAGTAIPRESGANPRPDAPENWIGPSLMQPVIGALPRLSARREDAPGRHDPWAGDIGPWTPGVIG